VGLKIANNQFCLPLCLCPEYYKPALQSYQSPNLATTTISFLAVLIFAAALLYSSVGHAGASGYLAAMALFGVAPDVMKPTALVLNILVAAIATVKFYRAGCFSWSMFWPFALGSVPFAFIGGAISLPGYLYKPVVGIVLFYAAYRLLAPSSDANSKQLKTVPIAWALVLGISIGLLSGLTGVGGGIFLSPVLLFMGWAEARQTAGISAPFILLNSIAGLSGHLFSISTLPSAIPIWAVAAIAGGSIGADYGSRRFGNILIKRLLAAVLVIAGFKMLVA
jgi:uncharacterized protein